MGENAALTAANVVYVDANGQLVGEAKLATSRGGLNLSSYTTGDLIYASSSSVFSKLAIGSTNQVLKVAGGLPSWATNSPAVATAAKTANYNVLSTDDALTGDSSGGAFTFTLPDCATNSGKVFRIKKIDSSLTAITISKAGSDTIQDYTTAATTTTINTQGEEIELVSFGSTVWQVTNRRIPSLFISYSPSFAAATGWGTPTNPSFFWKRAGDSVFIKGYFITGTLANSSGRIPLPSGLTLNTTVIPDASVVGTMGINAAHTAGPIMVLIDVGTTTSIAFGDWTGAGAINTNPTGLHVTSGDAVYFTAGPIPISGWNG